MVKLRIERNKKCNNNQINVSPKLGFHCLVNWTCYHSLFTMSTKYSYTHTAHSLKKKVKFANMHRKRL